MRAQKIHFIPAPENFGKIYSCIYGDISSQSIPLFAVHGGPGGCCDALTTLAKLVDSDFGGVGCRHPVIVYDQLGCGQSDNPNNQSTWNIEYYLQELQQIIYFYQNYYGFDQYDLLGHSWGGALVASLAIKQFTKMASVGLRKIVLSSPLLSSIDWMKDTKQRQKELPKETQNIIKQHESTGTTDSEAYQNAVDVFNASFLCRLDPKPEILINARKKFNNNIYLSMWGPSEFHPIGSLKNFSCVEQLDKISVECLLLSGFYDELYPETMRFYASRIRNSQLHIFMESSHAAYLEQTKEYLSVLTEFLSR